MGRRENDVDKRQAVCFHAEMFYKGKNFSMVYTKKYILLHVVTLYYPLCIFLC